MYTVKVNYTDVEGNNVEETLLFHMSSRDWIKADEEKRSVGGYSEYIASYISGDDTSPANVLIVLEDVIKRSYGVRSEDGKKFIRTQEVTDEFLNSLAYDAFLDDLLFRDGLSKDFIQSVLPKNVEIPEGMNDASGATPRS